MAVYLSTIKLATLTVFVYVKYCQKGLESPICMCSSVIIFLCIVKYHGMSVGAHFIYPVLDVSYLD
jgi:hypothetical protein